MGRLATARARGWLTIVYLVVAPLAALVSAGLETSSGVPAFSLTLAVAMAYLLSVGPRGYPAVVGAWLAHSLLVDGADPSLALVGVVLGEAAIVTAGARLVELRFASLGRNRRPRVVVEFALLAAGLVPVLLYLFKGTVVGFVGVERTVEGFVAHMLVDSIGVLGVTPGLRMLIMRQRVRAQPSEWVAVVAATGATVLAMLATAAIGGVASLQSAQVVLFPVLVVAVVLGTAGYATALALTAFAVLVPLSVLGVMAEVPVSAADTASWWVGLFAGLLLATVGDARRATLQQFQSFFDRSAAPSLTASMEDGTILRANEAASELFGRRQDALVGSPLLSLLSDPDASARLGEVVAGDEDEVAIEFRLVDDRGEERWVRCSAARVGLGGPQEDVLQVQFVDLTTEHDRATSLERTNDSLEQFGRRITHDLKQPVSAVAAYAATLVEHGQRMAPDMVRTMHERLADAARRAVQQLDDTYAAAAARDPGRVDVRLHELVADVVGVVDLALDEARATVSTNIMRAHVHSEPAVIRQILLNLVTNSLKYRRPDEAPRIHVASRARGAGVELVVTDNGGGIPPDALEEVFDRGVRLTPDQADGRGHGLTDSRELARSLGGTLTAEPWPDGARFVLWLPDPAAADAQSPTRVLVVAGREEARQQLRARLGHRSSVRFVGAVATVGDAVAEARDTRPDVILLDGRLAREEAVVEIARAHRDARIVLLRDDEVDVGAADARSVGAVRTVDLTMSDDGLASGLVGSPV